jgi:DNA polymerase-3 subunit epsilon
VTKPANLSARFTDEAEARACFHYSRLLGQLEANSDEVYCSAVTATLGGPQCTTDYASGLRNKAAHRVGLYFEKQHERTCNPALSRRLLSRLQ